jgi:glycosyltransferase involved in cell wall biosynthesis
MLCRSAKRLTCCRCLVRQERRMTRVLLNLPNLDGHRQVYCRELCGYCLSRGFSVTIATDASGLEDASRLALFQEHPHVRFVRDTWSEGAGASAQLRGLASAARQAAADVTFLGEADGAHGLLAAQIGRPGLRLPGRRVGLFIRSTNYVHRTPCPPMGRIGRAVAEAYTYRPLSLTQPRLFHEVVMRRFSLLEAALCLDEVFAATHDGRYLWLPDIAIASADGDDGSAEAATWEARVAAFVEARHGSPVVVYTGTPYARRGYQTLLQLASDVGGCFIHCGRPYDPGGDDPDEDLGARAALVSRSALLEFGGFYRSFETAQVSLRAARCVVLPYAQHFGSSGVMLQALMAGRPVLVSDQGLMAWRVRNFGLGLTFAAGDRRDMRYKFSLLQSTPPDAFADALSRFLAYFSRAQLESALDRALGVAEAAPRVPAVDK